MSGTQIVTSVSIISSLLGYQAVSLTNFNTSAESQIAAGSKVELASAFFTFASDEQPSGWSAIATSATAYITVTASGSAGTQIASAAYTSSAPVWSDSKQGWYTSALSGTRHVAKVYKESATQYENAVVLLPHQGSTGPVLYAQSLNVSGNVLLGGAIDVTGSIFVEGTGNFAGDVQVAGLIRGAIEADNEQESTSVTYGSVFTAMATYIPTTSLTMLVTGWFSTSSGGAPNIATYAKRVAADEISLYAITPSTGSRGATTIDQGGAGSMWQVNIRW